MKYYLLLFVLFFSIGCVYAGKIEQPHNNSNRQDSLPREHFFISGNAGFALPLEDYGTAVNTQLNSNEIQGYAKRGSTSHISCGVFVSSKLAILVNAGQDMNTVANTQPGIHYSGTFQILQYMGGLYYYVSLTHSAFLWVQALAGYVTANYPTEIKTFSTGVYTYNFQDGSALGLSFGTGFEKKLNRNFGVIATLAYTSAYIDYPSYSITTSGGASQNEYTHFYMYYGNLQLTAGLSFHL